MKTWLCVLQLTFSKRTLSKAGTSLRRTANLLPAELHLSLCNWTLSEAETSVSRTAGTFFQNFGSKTSQNGHWMFTQIYNTWKYRNLMTCVSRTQVNNKRKTTSFVLGLICKHSKFAWAVLGSVRMTKRDATGPSCDHEQWRFGYQVTWTLSKAGTTLKRTVALVPRVSALETVDCFANDIMIHCEVGTRMEMYHMVEQGMPM